MRTIFLLIFVCFCFAFAKAQSSQCYFVTAKNGLKLRQQPHTKAEVIEILPYGSKVLLISEYSLKPDSIKDGNKITTGNWVKIKTLFHDYNKNYGTEGYVYDFFLGEHIKTIPNTSIHNFTSFTRFSERKSETVEGVASRRELYRIGRNCTVSYENNPVAKSVLSDVVQFSKINYEDYRNRVVPNPYKLDKSFQPKRFPVADSLKATLGYTKYYLPIDNGRDSTLVSDHTGEWSSVTEYLGYIKRLDAHFITGFAEDQEIIKIDQKTGERSFFSSGSIHISPSGTYLLSIYNAIFSEETIFNLRFLNNPNQGSEIMFTSWFPAGQIEWINDHQFVIKVAAMDSRNFEKNDSFTYLLGTIKYN